MQDWFIVKKKKQFNAVMKVHTFKNIYKNS